MLNDRQRRLRAHMMMQSLSGAVGGSDDSDDQLEQLAQLRGEPADSQALDRAMISELKRLRAGLVEADGNLGELKKLLETVTAPPLFPGVFLGSTQASGEPAAIVAHGSMTSVVSVYADLDLSTVRVGDEVLLNSKKNLIMAKSSEQLRQHGETAVFDRYDDASHAVLKSRDEETVVRLSGPLLETELRNGDLLRWSRELCMAFDKIDKASTDQFFLEETPKETFADIGGLDEQISRLKALVALRIEHPSLVAKYNLPCNRSVLLHGPPGTGKTMMARAFANYVGQVSKSGESRFISVKPGEFNSQWFGRSERKVREVFQAARKAAKENPDVPVVMFLDEIDAISSSEKHGHAVDNRVLKALMVELSGFDDRGNVLVLASTNRLADIDEALMRPGRLGDLLLEVPKPNRSAARSIVEKHFPASLPYYSDQKNESQDELRESIVASMISRLYSPNSDSELARLTMRDATQRTVHVRDMLSGAALAKITDDAKRSACEREARSGESGVRHEDILSAVDTHIDGLAKLLTPASAKRYLDDLPQDVDVVRVDRITSQTPKHVQRFIRAA